MATYKAVLNNKPKSDGTHTIFIQIIHNRKVKRVSTGYSVKPGEFNPKAKHGKYVRTTHPQHKLINDQIQKKIDEARERETKLKAVTVENIKQTIKSEAVGESFLLFADEVITNLQANPSAFRTYKRHKTIIQKLRGFLKGKDLLFPEIDHAFLERYKAHLYSIGNRKNTVHCDLRTIRSILYRAIDQGKFDQSKNPFFTFKLELEHSHKAALTLDELDRLQALDLTWNTLIWHVRNYFMLAYYFHGIRIGDFVQLKKKNFIDGRLIYVMGKTSEVASIKIPEKAQAILGHYLHEDDGLTPDDFVFPILRNDLDYSDQVRLYKAIAAKNALINKYLKKLAKLADIEKNVSFHVARSSFANTARQKIQDISKIQKFLRHSSIRVTEQYLARISDTELDNDSDEIFR